MCVVRDREGLISLISQLSSDEELIAAISTNEDSSSQEIEKPITDTGQQNSNGVPGEDSNTDTSKLNIDIEPIVNCKSTLKEGDKENVSNIDRDKLKPENINRNNENTEVLNNKDEISKSAEKETEKNESFDKEKVESKDCDEESKVISSEIIVDSTTENTLLKSNENSVPTEILTSSDKPSKLKNSVESIKENIIKNKTEKKVKGEESAEIKKHENEKSVVKESADLGKLPKMDENVKSIEKIDTKSVMETAKNLVTSECSTEMKAAKCETSSKSEKKEHIGKTILEQTLSTETTGSHEESMKSEEKMSSMSKQSSLISVNIDNNSCVDLSNKKHTTLDKSIDVAEELKQRGALLKTNAPHFRGKGNNKNAPGSKLDQIFSFKRGLDLSKPPESQPLRAHFVGSSQSQFGSQILDKLKLGSLISSSSVSDSGNYNQCSDKSNFSAKRQVEDLSIAGEKRRIPEDLSVHPKKKAHMQESTKIEVSEAIEEPMMLVKGEGSGKECETENTNREMIQRDVNERLNIQMIPLKDVDPERKCESRIFDREEIDIEVSEAIEEPIMIIVGEGSGKECDTGNPGKDPGNNEENMNCHKIGMSEDDGTSHGVDSEIVDGERNTEDSSSTSITKSVSEIDKKSSKLWSIDNICNTASLDVNNKLIVNDVSILQNDGNAGDGTTSDEKPVLLDFSQSNIKSDSEKNLRRKSLDNCNKEDKDTEPPEAKKTKIINESIEVRDPIETIKSSSGTNEETVLGPNTECKNNYEVNTSGNKLILTKTKVVEDADTVKDKSKNELSKKDSKIKKIKIKSKKPDNNIINENKGSTKSADIKSENKTKNLNDKSSKISKIFDNKSANKRNKNADNSINFEQPNHVSSEGKDSTDQSENLKKSSNLLDLKVEDNLKKLCLQNTSDLDSGEENNSEPINSADGDDTSSEFKGFIPTELTEKQDDRFSNLIEKTDKFTILNSLNTNSDKTALSINKNTELEDLQKLGDENDESKRKTVLKNIQISGSKINNSTPTFSTIKDSSEDKSIKISIDDDEQNLIDNTENKHCDMNKNKDSSIDNKITSKSKTKTIKEEVKVAPRTRSRRSSAQPQSEISPEESNKEIENTVINVTTGDPEHKSEKMSTSKNKKSLTQKSESTVLSNTEFDNTKEDTLECINSNNVSKINKAESKKKSKGKSKSKNEVKDNAGVSKVNVPVIPDKAPGRSTRSSRRVNNIIVKPLAEVISDIAENKSNGLDATDENVKTEDSKPEDETAIFGEKCDIVDPNKKDVKTNKNSKNKIKESVPVSSRKRRSSKRLGEKESNDESENLDKDEEKSGEEEGAGGKRRKVKGIFLQTFKFII